MKAKNLKKEKKRNLALVEKRAISTLKKCEKEFKEFTIMDDYDGGQYSMMRNMIRDLKFILNER